MAEAIAVGFDQFNRKLVVHVNGAFHSDFGLGTAERVRRRLNGRRVVVVSMLPVKDLDRSRPQARTCSAPTTWSTPSPTKK